MRFLVIVAIIGYLAFFSTSSFSKNKDNRQESVRVLIDISGSMKKSDPNNLRVPALNLLLNMLPAESEGGAWLFGESVAPLVKLGQVNEAWKKKGLASSKKIHSRGLFTHIGLALETAIQDWTPTDAPQSRSVILLTDGVVDISKSADQNKAERQRVLNEVLPKLRQTKAKVHTIALSDNADHDLLKAIATETDGFFATAHEAEDLLKIFLQAFDQSIEQEQVPLVDNMFEIDSSVKEFTALIFRMSDSKPSQIKTPLGDILSEEQQNENASWYSEAGFDLVTVRNPEPGTWQLEADIDPDNRVTVMSDLKVRLEGLPNNVIVGDKLHLSFFMEQDGTKIDRVEFLSLLDINFKQKYLKNEKVWEGKITSHSTGVVRVPKDGRFNAKLGKTLLPGLHEFSVEVDGKTFVRRKSKRLTVHAGPADVVTVAQEVDEGVVYFLNVVPIRGLIKKDSLEIQASVQYQRSGSSVLLSAEETEFGSWKVEVPASRGDGLYEVTLKVAGTTEQGREFNVDQGPYPVFYGEDRAANEANLASSELEPGETADAEPKKDVAEIPPVETPKSEKNPDLEEPEIEEAEPVLEDAEDDLEALDDESMEALGEEASASSNLFWIIGAIVINILVAGVGYIIYQKVMSSREKKDRDADDQLIAEIEKVGSELGADEEEAAEPQEIEETAEAGEAEASPEPEKTDKSDQEIGDMLDELDDVFGGVDDDKDAG